MAAANNMELLPRAQVEFRATKPWELAYSTCSREELGRWYGRGSEYKLLFRAEREESELKGKSENLTVARLGGYIQDAVDMLEDYGISKMAHVHDSAASPPRYAKKLDVAYTALDTSNFKDSLAPSDLIIDDGLLDYVVMTSTDPSQFARTYFETVTAALTPEGKFVLVTLAHEPVIAEFMRFYRSSGLRITGYPVTLANDSAYCHPFVFVVKNEPASPKSDTENNGASILWNLRFWETKKIPPSSDSIFKTNYVVKHLRKTNFFKRDVQMYKPGQLAHFVIMGPAAEDPLTREICYNLSIYDRVYPDFETVQKRTKFMNSLKPTIAILVPVADQHHWLYKTPHGHQRLAERGGCRRIISVFLPDFGPLSGANIHPVETVEKIKAEIGKPLIDLSVDKNHPVLLMTQQENFVDERRVVCRDESEFAGKILVFDAVVDVDDEEFKSIPEEDDLKPDVARPPKASKYMRRSMIFECNPRMAQTELWYKQKENELEFDFTHICHAYHIIMVTMLMAMNRNDSTQVKGLILGLGGGMLPMLFKKLLGDSVSLDVVDIDPVVASLAQKHFGFVTDEQTRLHLGDGAKFVCQAATASSQYDFVVVDINSTVGDLGGGFESVSAPPKPFLTEEFLQSVAKCVGSNGIVMVNTVSHAERGRKSIVQAIRNHFKNGCSLTYSDDLNEIFLLHNGANMISKEDMIDTRSVLLRKASIFPEISRVIAATPMYLGKRARFPISIRNW